MEIQDWVVPYKISNSEFKLYCIGDIHAGTVHCVEDKIKAKVAEIAQEKNALWIGMGDYAEFITPKDKRFDPNQKSIAGWVEPDNIAESQTKWVVDLFKPISKKCVGLLYGNHEESMRIFNHDNVQKNICERLNVKNLGFISFVRFFFRRENSNETHIISGVFTHGYGWAVTPGTKLNTLIAFMNKFGGRNVLIYCYAHMHDIITHPRPYMTITDSPFDHAKIKEQTEWGAISGSWFRTYTQGIIASYGEKKVYPPTVLGCAVFTINADTGEIDVRKSK